MPHSFPTRRSSEFQVVGADRGQDAAVAADRRAHGIADVGVVHSIISSGRPVSSRTSSRLTPSTSSITRAPSGPSANTPTSVYTRDTQRSEEHTSELQSLMRISYAVFCLKKKKTTNKTTFKTN